MEKKFTLQEGSKKLGLDIYKVRDWIGRGYIDPDFPSTAKGSANELSIWNLYHLATFNKLIRFGWSREKAASYLRHFSKFLKKNPDLIEKDYMILLGEALNPKSIFKDGRYIRFINEDDLGTFVPKMKEKWPEFTIKDFDSIIYLNLSEIRKAVNK